MNEQTFGEYLRQKRLEKGFGLRSFARLIDMDAANLSNIERGKINPPRNEQLLSVIADALGLGSNAPERAELFDLAVADTPDRLAADLVGYAKDVQLVPLLLRTVANKQLTEEQIRELSERINEAY